MDDGVKMGTFLKIGDVDTWRKKLGLLPVPLFDLQTSKEKYVLLNGNFGNFCLDLKGEPEELKPRNYAWSSDVGHYVNIINDNVEIYKWDKRATSLERYSIKSVENNLEKFYEYLLKDQPRRDISIVPFTVNIFRKLRGAFTDPSIDGQTSLKAFLYLLACTSDNVSRGNLDAAKWHLDDAARDVTGLIRPGDWQRLMDELIEGLPLYTLKPDISLLLRHASGRLFQEAHYIATVEDANQIALEGFLPKRVSLSQKTKSIGIHYTPSSIVRTLVEEVLSVTGDLPSSLTIFDPACGSSEFLKEILRQLSLSNYTGKITLIGWDISQAAVDISNFVLAREAEFWSHNVSIEISRKDAIEKTTIWPQNVDIVLMNPPFRSWQDMDGTMRETVKSIPALRGIRPDMASLFIWKAAHSLRNDGILGTILPASILDADSYKKFRGEFAAIMSPLLIGKLGSQSLFAKALVDAAIYVGQVSNKTSVSAIALWADHRRESASAALRALRQHRAAKNREYSPIEEDGYSIYPNPVIGKSVESWAARSYKAYKLFSDLRNFSRVKDFFEVQQGARTGFKPAFILSKSTVNNLPSKEQAFFRPAVINESIKDGCLTNSAYVFYPYGENIPIIDAEEDLKKHLKVYYKEYLLTHKERLLQRARKGESNWWKLSEHRAWQREQCPKLVSTFFGKAGYFAWDNTGEFVVVQGHRWKPKSTKHEKDFSKEVGLAYLAILCSPLIDILLSYVSNHLGGGQWDLSQKCIQNLPLPDLFSKSIDTKVFGKLVQIGTSINECKGYDKDGLKQLILYIYGLPDNTALF